MNFYNWGSNPDNYNDIFSDNDATTVMIRFLVIHVYISKCRLYSSPLILKDEDTFTESNVVNLEKKY